MTRELAIVMASELVRLCDRALEPEVCGIPNYWPNLTITGQDVQDLRDMLSALLEDQP